MIDSRVSAAYSVLTGDSVKSSDGDGRNRRDVSSQEQSSFRDALKINRLQRNSEDEGGDDVQKDNPQKKSGRQGRGASLAQEELKRAKTRKEGQQQVASESDGESPQRKDSQMHKDSRTAAKTQSKDASIGGKQNAAHSAAGKISKIQEVGGKSDGMQGTAKKPAAAQGTAVKTDGMQATAGKSGEAQSAAGKSDGMQATAGKSDGMQATAGKSGEAQSAAGRSGEAQSATGKSGEAQSATGKSGEMPAGNAQVVDRGLTAGKAKPQEKMDRISPSQIAGITQGQQERIGLNRSSYGENMEETVASPRSDIEKLGKQIANRILVSTPKAAGSQQIRIQLKSDILPQTDVQISRNAGQLAVSFITGNKDTERFLARNLDHIQRSLRSRLSGENVHVQLASEQEEREENEGRSRQHYIPSDDA